MSSRPHWFGVDRSTFGMVDWPGAARAGVVICPPLGYEAVTSHRALRDLAESLHRRGIASLRVAYPATGNSLRIGLADDVAEWIAATENAVAELRSFGVHRVALVGVRFSATLAAHVATTVGADALALWDPVLSGRRSARALRLLAADSDHEVSIAGVVFDAPTLAAMSRMSLQLDQLTTPTLVIAPSDSATEVDAPLPADVPVTIERLPGTAGLLDTDAELSVVPEEILERISAWLDAAVAGAIADAADAAEAPVLCATTTEVVGDVAIVHEAHRAGPFELFAVTSAQQGAQPRQAVVFLNNGVAPAVGPGSAWLDWAKEVVAAGFMAARLDFDGLGDSPVRPGTAPNDSYPTGAAEDVSDLIDLLRRRGIERVTLVGLCSGALLSFDAALRRPEITQIVALNPRFDKPYHDRSLRRVRAGGQTNRLFAVPLHKTPLFRTFETVPAPVWSVLSWLRLVPRATLAVERVVAKGTKVTLVFGPDEFGLRAMKRRAPKRFARLEKHPLVSLAIVDSLDHSMFDRRARRDVEATLRTLFAASLRGGQHAHISSSEVVLHD